MLRLLAAAVAALFVLPAFAGEDCSGQANKLIEAAGIDGGIVLTDFGVRLAPFDREVIVGFGDGTQSIWFFRNGCMVSAPVVILPPSVHKVTPSVRPKPKGVGPQVGA